MTNIRSRAAFVVGVLVFLLASAPFVAFAASGDLDTSFDTDGTVTTAFGSGGFEASNAQAVAIQSDGKIVAAGDCYVDGVSLTQDFCLARYNTDGSLDTSFDNDGKVTTPIGTFDYPRALAIQSGDQKIVVAGFCVIGSTNDFCLARYNQNGSLDTSFDTDGKVTTPIGSANDAAFAMAIQRSDGKIVVAGSCVVGSTDDFCLARYNTDGSLDTSFDNDGKVTNAISTGTDLAYAVAVQSDGKIVVAGLCAGAGFDFCLARYNTNGSVDTSFDTDGRVITAIATGSLSDFAYAVAIQSDGKIVAAGYCDAGNSQPHDFCLARYNASDGSLDGSFDTDGKVLTPIGTASDKARAVAVQSNGKIVVAGHCNNPGTDDFCLARYTSAGALDTTFGSAATGTVLTAIGPHSDQAVAVALQGDGKIVAAGSCRTDTATSPQPTNFCLARYDGDVAGVPNLAQMIAMINAEPLLTGGQKSALIAKLDEAQAAYAAGKVNNACGKLGAFIGQVEGLVPDKLSAETAASLIAGANALKADYGCP